MSWDEWGKQELHKEPVVEEEEVAATGGVVQCDRSFIVVILNGDDGCPRISWILSRDPESRTSLRHTSDSIRPIVTYERHSGKWLSHKFSASATMKGNQSGKGLSRQEKEAGGYSDLMVLNEGFKCLIGGGGKVGHHRPLSTCPRNERSR